MNIRSTSSALRQQTLEIWNAGVDAVRADRLVAERLKVTDEGIAIDETVIPFTRDTQVMVVGAGKAGARMAAGLEAAFGEARIKRLHLSGWVNVPEMPPASNGQQQTLQAIHLHPARPAGCNEPTAAAVEGTREILRRVGALTEHAVCIALISGGGSALLPAPVAGITLDDKLAVTRFLSAHGANIEQLNTVRKQLSEVKGGGLARACRAGRLLTLVISDVLGDPLDVIASGPTVPDTATPRDALSVLAQFDPQRMLPAAVYQTLEARASDAHRGDPSGVDFQRWSQTVVLGNNATAVDAAGVRAEQLGFSHAMHSATSSEGAAEAIGRHLADMAMEMLRNAGPDCLITGGEPTVQLADESVRGKGGRNQQLVLAALQRLIQRGDVTTEERDRLVILSGGTDGEDGPTDAAGAILDANVWRAIEEQGLDIEDALRRNDAYSLFQATGGLLISGPTGTNVCDVRVVAVRR